MAGGKSTSDYIQQYFRRACSDSRLALEYRLLGRLAVLVPILSWADRDEEPKGDAGTGRGSGWRSLPCVGDSAEGEETMSATLGQICR